MAEVSLHVEINNTRPVELADFSNSFFSLADEFKRHLESEDPEIAAADVRLYVQEVRAGSIIANLVALAPHALQLMSYANAVLTFGKHIKTAYDYLSGNSEEKPALDKVSLQNLSSIVEPVAKDNGAQINIGVLNGPLIAKLDSTLANAVQNKARKEIELLREPSTGVHEKVVLYWFQARGDAKSKVGDRAIIESISSRPVKTICVNDRIKAQMILEDENPFKWAYIVDVTVETIGGKPALYKILTIHDKFEREPSD